MSLKSFHVVFISVSVVLCLGFGLWTIQQGAYTALGILSFLCAAGLMVYGIWFLRKMKTIDSDVNSTTGIAVLMLLALWWPRAAEACSVCYGDPNSLMVRGMNMGIFLLLGVTGFVLACVAWFMISLWRKGRLAAETAATQ